MMYIKSAIRLCEFVMDICNVPEIGKGSIVIKNGTST